MSDLGGLDEMEEKVDNSATVKFPDKKSKRRPFHYWTVRDKDYRLKLNTSMIEKLENKYRTNIINLVSNDGIPPLSVMLTVVQAAMAPWEHGIDYKKVQNLYDNWFEDGGNQITFFSEVLMPTMAVSGFFTEKQAASIMESMKDMDELL